ncbi:hypothetical protein PG995_009221 [Apiospora arundinis]
METQREPGNRDIELNEICQDDLDRKPWKYVGYKEFARYSSSADEFFVLRRYDRLHCRVLLTMQQRIAVLEEKLDALDERLSRTTEDIDNGTVRTDQSERRALVEESSKELKAYADMVLSYKQLKSAPSAPKWSVKNINTWLDNNNGPIETTEVEFLKAEDLISVTNSRKSWLRLRFEKHVLSATQGFYGLLGERDGLDKTNTYGKDEPVDSIAAVVIFFVAMAMLIVPLWVLAKTENMDKRLGIITAFIAILLGVITWGTSAKPFEILAATAGYSAVLVVFLQSGV